MGYRRGTVLFALFVAYVLFLGAGEPDVGAGSGIRPSVHAGRGWLNSVGEVSIDTTKFMARHNSLPNLTAREDSTDANGDPWIFQDSYYDSIASADDGTAVRYGFADQNSPNTVQDNGGNNYLIQARHSGSEDNHTGDVRFRSYIWFALPPGLKQGHRVESAHVMTNVAAFESNIIDPGAYISLRADTLAADYAIVASVSQGSDPARFDMTWNQLDDTQNTAWAPDLTATQITGRDDWHDAGPRSDTSAQPATLTAGQGYRWDVTDAVQQIVDNGNAGRGVMFVVSPVGGTDNPAFAAGNHATFMNASNGRGNPQFTMTYTNKRGSKPWGGVRVPLVMSIDDQHETTAPHFDLIRNRGHRVSAMVSFAGATNEMNQAQLDSFNVDPNTDFVMHGRAHSGLGTLGTDNEIDFEIARDWNFDGNKFTDARDTLNTNDFAWIGGVDAAATYSLEGMSRIVENGYRASRSATNTWSVDIGEMTQPGWDRYVNMHAIATLLISAITGNTGSERYTDDIREYFLDYVDLAYTDYGRAFISAFWHDNHTSLDFPNGIDYDQLEDLLDIVDSLHYVDTLEWKQVINMRRDGSPRIAAATVVAAVGGVRTVQDSLSAAIHDSFKVANTDPNMDELWVGPK